MVKSLRSVHASFSCVSSCTLRYNRLMSLAQSKLLNVIHFLLISNNILIFVYLPFLLIGLLTSPLAFTTGFNIDLATIFYMVAPFVLTYCYLNYLSKKKYSSLVKGILLIISAGIYFHNILVNPEATGVSVLLIIQIVIGWIALDVAMKLEQKLLLIAVGIPILLGIIESSFMFSITAQPIYNFFVIFGTLLRDATASKINIFFMDYNGFAVYFLSLITSLVTILTYLISSINSNKSRGL